MPSIVRKNQHVACQSITRTQTNIRNANTAMNRTVAISATKPRDCGGCNVSGGGRKVKSHSKYQSPLARQCTVSRQPVSSEVGTGLSPIIWLKRRSPSAMRLATRSAKRPIGESSSTAEAESVRAASRCAVKARANRSSSLISMHRGAPGAGGGDPRSGQARGFVRGRKHGND